MPPEGGPPARDPIKIRLRGGGARGDFGVTLGSLFRRFFSDFFGLFPGLFPSIFGMFRDHEMTILGGCKGRFRRFLDIFRKCSPLFFRWFLTIFRQLLFFLGGKVDRTLRGPWGPRGPSYIETPDIPPLKAAGTGNFVGVGITPSM